MENPYYIDYSDIICLSTTPSFRFFVPENQNKIDYQYFAYTLDSISLLFSRYYPLKGLDLNIALSDIEESPICLRELHTILLKTTDSAWVQAAYQFSHELCHYMIPSDVVSNLRWFEESICETASCFFLKKLTLLWLYNGVSVKSTDGQLFAYCFSDYIDNVLNSSKEFDIHNADELCELEKQCYLRNKNTFISSLLLPIFSKYDDTWRVVPLLSSIPAGLCLMDSLDYWDQLSGGNFKGIKEISRLFLSE